MAIVSLTTAYIGRIFGLKRYNVHYNMLQYEPASICMEAMDYNFN
jgi:hypothetical protein